MAKSYWTLYCSHWFKVCIEDTISHVVLFINIKKLFTLAHINHRESQRADDQQLDTIPVHTTEHKHEMESSDQSMWESKSLCSMIYCMGTYFVRTPMINETCCTYTLLSANSDVWRNDPAYTPEDHFDLIDQTYFSILSYIISAEIAGMWEMIDMLAEMQVYSWVRVQTQGYISTWKSK